MLQRSKMSFVKHSRYLDHPIVCIDKTDQLKAREQRSNLLEGDTLLLPCWSMDLAKNEGSKKFFVGGLDAFITYYLPLADTEKNFYELIHNNFPVKLYFDIDIKSEKQPDQFEKYANASEVTKMIDNTLAAAFTDDTLIETKIILESSSETKRSFHIIYPKIVFDNIKSLGDWIKTNKTSFSDSTIIDVAPYNSFQSFRIHLSSKKGKNKPIKLLGFDDLNDAEKIKASLVQHFESADELCVFSFHKSLSETQTKKRKHRSTTLDPLTKEHSDIQVTTIKTILTKNNIIPANAKAYTIDLDSSIVFSFSGKCELANRVHASNMIKFVFYVKSMKGMYCCYDPDCAALNKTWGYLNLEPLFTKDMIIYKVVERYKLSFATDTIREHFIATTGTIIKALCSCQHQRFICISLKFMQCKGCCTSKRFTKKFIQKLFAQCDK